MEPAYLLDVETGSDIDDDVLAIGEGTWDV